MQFYKFSFFALFFIFSITANASSFSSLACLKSSFNETIKHKTGPLSLIPNELIVVKKSCQITISFKKFLTTKWEIDICRGPIHIKREKNGILDVLRKDKEKASDFNKEWEGLKQTLEDHGLIFALGQRSLLQDQHGKIYCSLLLLSKYLENEVIFSPQSEKEINLFPEVSNVKECELAPVVKPAPLSPSKISETPSQTSPQVDVEELPEF